MPVRPIYRIQCLSRRHLLIRPTVIKEQFAPVFGKRRKVWIELVDVFVHSVRLRGITCKVETSPIPIGIVVDDVAELVPEKRRGLRPARQPRPCELRSRLEAWKVNPPRRVRCGTDNRLRGIHLASRQAIGTVSILALELFEIRVTARRILDQSVL